MLEASFCVINADCCACFNALNLGSLLGSVFKYQKTVAVFVVLICGRHSPQHKFGTDARLATSKELICYLKYFSLNILIAPSQNYNCVCSYLVHLLAVREYHTVAVWSFWRQCARACVWWSSVVRGLIVGQSMLFVHTHWLYSLGMGQLFWFTVICPVRTKYSCIE